MLTEYGDSTRTGERFLYDGHTSSNLNIGMNLTELPPSTNWGHWHANMVELWVNVYGNVCALISGVGVVHGELGDVINANEERWHRATSCPNTGRSIRMAMTPRSKEGQVHYYQTDQLGEVGLRRQRADLGFFSRNGSFRRGLEICAPPGV